MKLNPTFDIVSVLAVIISISAVVAYAGTNQTAQTNSIPGKYIVVYKDSVPDSETTTTELEKKHGISSEMKYSKVLKGFTAKMDSITLAKVKMDPRVAFVSEDRIVSIDGKPSDVGDKGTAASLSKYENRSEHADEHSARSTTTPSLPSDDKDLDANARKNRNSTSTQPASSTQPLQPAQPAQMIPLNIKRVHADTLTNKGTGVGVAIIDTGIDLTHPDLVANIAPVSKTCVAGTVNAQDDNGHGTHVAGTIAGANNSIGVVGVAPEARLYAVKVLDSTGSGTWSSIICGIDWVTANAQVLNIKVANMSLGGAGTSDNNCGLTNGDALHRAICNSTAKGVTYVVAAGNSAADSSQSVPASYNDTVITVSALADSDGMFGGFSAATPYGADDTFATFSNYGTPVDIGAPGVNVYSTWKGGTYSTLNGTSMASPHVAGAAALYLKSNPTATWTQVRSALQYFGEALRAGHSDPSGLHGEPVLNAILP